MGRCVGLESGSGCEQRAKLFILRNTHVTASTIGRGVNVECTFVARSTEVEYPRTTRLLSRHLNRGLFSVSKSVSTQVDSANKTRKVFLITRELSGPVDLGAVGGNDGFMVLGGLRSPNGIKAVLHYTSTYKVSKMFLYKNYSLCGPGLVHSAVNSLFELPISARCRCCRLLRGLTSGNILACTSIVSGSTDDLHSFGFSNDYTMIVNGRNGNLSRRRTTTYSNQVAVGVGNGVSSLGTTATTSVVV